MYRILCANCKTHVYNYKGEFTGPVKLSDFEPIEGSQFPAPNKPCVCYKCKKAWHLLRKNGSIAVITDKGIKPQPPIEGKLRHTLLPELPQQAMEDEFRDPAELRRTNAKRGR